MTVSLIILVSNSSMEAGRSVHWNFAIGAEYIDIGDVYGSTIA